MFSSWQYKRFHVSYGIGVLCFAILLGIACAKILGVSREIHWLLMLMLGCEALVVLARIRWYSLAAVMVLGTMLGVMRGSNYAYQLERIAWYEGRTMYARGIIAEDPQKSPRGSTRLVVHDIKAGSDSYTGQLWLETNDTRKFRRCDAIAFHGLMKAGFGPYVLKSTNGKIDGVKPGNDPLLALRDLFASALRSVVIEPAASLGIGFVVGQKSSLTPELEQQLRIVGLTHLVVASGYNLTILMRFAKRLFEARSKFMTMTTSIVLMVGFIGISGASPSMMRAGMVAGLSLLAWHYGRTFHPMLLILYVAGATAWWQPLYEWADIGWWLSFLAFFGVLILSPLIVKQLYRDKKPGALLQIVCESIAAQIMTLPLILMIFGSLPVLSIVANVVSAPLIPMAMLLTFIAGIVAMTVPSIALMAALPAEIVLSYFVAVVRTLSLPAWAQIDVAITWQTMGLLYGLIAAAVGLLWRTTRHDFRSQSIID